MTRTINNPEDIRTHLWRCITSEGFRRGQGLGAEPPLFLAPYPPKLDGEMSELLDGLRGLAVESGITVGIFNVFRSFMLAIHGTGQPDDYFKLEETMANLGKQRLTQALDSALDLDTVFSQPFNEFVAAGGYDVVFITGFTGAFPHVRASQVSVALEDLTHRCPVVVFVPGVTRNDSGHLTLKLFDVLDERHNYRATDIYEYEPAAKV